MRFEQLLYLIEVHRSPSLAIAAENLHVTRQALSAALKSLEQELDEPLLNRNVKGATLTEKGREVLAFAEEIIQLQQDFLQQFNRNKPQRLLQGKIRLMTQMTLRTLILPPILVYFKKRYPNITFTLENREVSDMVTSLANGEVDLVFLHRYSEPFADCLQLPKNLNFHPLCTCKPFIWCNVRSALTRYKSIPLQEIVHYPAIFDSRINHAIFWPALKTTPSTSLKIAITGNNLNILERALEDNLGILWDYQINDDMLYRTCRSNPKLQMVFIDCPYRIEAGYALCASKTHKPHLAALLDYLNQHYPQT